MAEWIELGTVEAICAHFGGCYRALLAAFTGDEQRMGIGRRLLHAHARKALVERLGWDEPTAIELAHELVGLAPGAVLPKMTELFNMVPQLVKKQPGAEAAKVLNLPLRVAPKAISQPAKVLFPRPAAKADDSWAF